MHQYLVITQARFLVTVPRERGDAKITSQTPRIGKTRITASAIRLELTEYEILDHLQFKKARSAFLGSTVACPNQLARGTAELAIEMIRFLCIFLR